MKCPPAPPSRLSFPRQLCITLSLVLGSISSLIAQPDYTNAYSVSTFAGKAGAGSTDTTATVPKFSSPQGVAVDGNGNLYVADANNNKLRKVTPAGVVTTLASGFDDPRAVAVDASGNVYVADASRSSIRKVSPNGVVSYLIWAHSSSFVSPAGVAVGPDGSVYVSDDGNNRICVIPPVGSCYILAQGLAIIDHPAGLAVDSHGTVYMADNGYSRILKIRADGKASILASEGISSPRGIAVDGSGNVFVSVSAGEIRKITGEGVVTTVGSSSFYYPAGVAVDGGGDIFIAEEGGERILKMTQSGVVSVVAGSYPGGDADSFTTPSFNIPTGIAMDGGGNMYVADSNNEKIRKITPNGIVSTLAGSGTFGNKNGTGTAARFSNPKGIAVDTGGNVYVADYNNHSIRKITPLGAVTTLAGTGTNGSAEGNGTAAGFNYPEGVAVDASGNVFVSDSGNHKIRKITPAGDVTTFAGSGTQGDADGSGTAASFRSPAGLAIDGGGNLYVADRGNHKIRKITAGGAVTTFAGNGSVGKTDASAAASSFSQPWGVAVDGDGNVYVTDSNNESVRKITSGGAVKTLAGDEFSNGETVVPDPHFNYNSGTGRGADVRNPAGVVAAGDGSIYFADCGLHQIRRGVAAATQTVSFPKPDGETFGADPFTPYATASSGLEVTFSIVSGPAKMEGGEIALTGVGLVVVRASQAGGTGYASAPDVEQSFSVSKAPQKISFGLLAGKVFEGPGSPFNLKATASSESPVYFSVVSGPATIAGGRVKLTGPGTVVIRASQPGNSYYLPATPVDRSFAVGPSTVASLSHLFVKSVRLSHVFVPGKLGYSAKVKNEIDSTTITPFTTSKVAGVIVNGRKVQSGAASQKIALEEGINMIVIVVVAQNGAERTYILKINREKPVKKPHAAVAAVLKKPTLGTPELKTTTSVSRVNGLKYLTITIPKSGNPIAKPTVEVSSDLMDWHSGEDHTTVLLDTAEWLQVRDNVPLALEGKRYIRVRK